MDRLGSGAARDVEDALLVQVALGRRARADQIRLVGVRDVRRRAVDVGVHRHGPDPELPESPEDADRDLTSIRD